MPPCFEQCGQVIFGWGMPFLASLIFARVSVEKGGLPFGHRGFPRRISDILRLVSSEAFLPDLCWIFLW